METFTESLGEPINALYRNYVTDLVSVTHLGVVDARFKKDDIWCLGESQKRSVGGRQGGHFLSFFLSFFLRGRRLASGPS